MIDTSKIDLCFYKPSDAGFAPSIIDVARTNDKGETVTYFHGMTLEKLREIHPTAQLDTIEAVQKMREDAVRSDPMPISEEQYWDALECLPPLDWVVGSHAESFKMVERYSGRMTNIYARLGRTYWCFMDVDTLPHLEIIAKVRAAAHKEVAA